MPPVEQLSPAVSSAGTEFWKGFQYVREGEAGPLGEEQAQQASHVVSSFAEAVDECQPEGRGTVGQLLRRKFDQVPFLPSLVFSIL